MPRDRWKVTWELAGKSLENATDPMYMSQLAHAMAFAKVGRRWPDHLGSSYKIFSGFSEYRSGFRIGIECRNLFKIRGSINGTEECSEVDKCIGPHWGGSLVKGHLKKRWMSCALKGVKDWLSDHGKFLRSLNGGV